MSDVLRCPFCRSNIPGEALYCSRCGGKIPRGQGTAPGIAPRTPTPLPAAQAEQATPAVGPTDPASPAPTSSPSSGTSPSLSSSSPSYGSTGGASSSMSMSSPSQSMSLSRIQRPARGLRIVLLLLGAGVCVAAGWALGRAQRTEPIAAVAAPPVVELGQPRVAVGADLPDPSRFLEPTPEGGTTPSSGRSTTPARPRSGDASPDRPAPAAPGKAPGNAAGAQPAPAPAGQANANAGAAGGAGQTPPAPGAAGGQAGGAAEPAAVPDEPEGPEGQLDTRAVIYVVRHYLPQVRACYERQLRNQPELHGQITMRFTVGAGGRVTSTSVVSNSTGSDALATCVASNLRSWRFPEPEGGPVAFEYPFRFGSPTATPAFPGATQDP